MPLRPPRNSRTFIRLIITAAPCCLLLAAVLAGCKPPPDQRSRANRKDDKQANDIRADKAFLTPVLTQRVVRRDLSSFVATTGNVVPVQSRLLRAEEAGRLEFTRSWREGDAVKKGDLIARIDSTSLRGEVERGEADIRLAEESLDIARKSMNSAVREYQTFQDLYTRGIAAQRDLDTAQLSMQRAVNSYRQDEIQLGKAKASLATIMERTERLEIIAPFDGLVVARGTLEGSKPFSTVFGTESITDFDGRLVSGEFAVCGVIDISQVFLRCDITARDIERVRLDQPARAVLYGKNDIPAQGHVASISKGVSQDTRAFSVDVLVPNEGGLLRPGMFGRVDIVTDTIRDTIVVEKAAITRRNGRDVVFVVEKQEDTETMLAKAREVTLGLEGRDEVEVTFGLREGDQLVIRGMQVLQDGTAVSPTEAGTVTATISTNADDSATSPTSTDTAASATPQPAS